MTASDIKRYELKNENGCSIVFLNYGGIIQSISVPDKDGNFDDVVLGFDNAEDYLGKHPHFGGLIGRYANRVANGRLIVDGRSVHVSRNKGNNHIHGGFVGFDRVLWSVEVNNENTLATLRYTSPDGEEGYPGNLDVEVIYRLTNDNKLITEYSATTDKATHVNLTNHSYFQLAPTRVPCDLETHELEVFADKYLAVDRDSIPLGSLRTVEHTPFDFRMKKSIAKDLYSRHAQIVQAGGYDHCMVLIKKQPDELSLAAVVNEAITGRKLSVWTTEPGLQLYSSNNLNCIGKGGKHHRSHAAFCLETQHFPDTPNISAFPSTLLKPGEKYYSSTEFHFSVTEEIS
jgi:aldose 1-epimerase